jgi:hypothetical protein
MAAPETPGLRKKAIAMRSAKSYSRICARPIRLWCPPRAVTGSSRLWFVKRPLCIFVELGLAMSLSAPFALAQKPPTPPPPPVTPPGAGSASRPGSSSTPLSSQPDMANDFVMFVTGQVATNDGSSLPNNAIVERVCNAKVRQQVYANPDGAFSMQLGSVNDTTLDASADGSSPAVPNQFSQTGIPRRLLDNCDLRASVAGFESPTISLVELGSGSDGKMLEVGTIRVHRRGQVPGATLNAAAYKGVPQPAIAAYEKGLEAEKKGKLASAQNHFEKAVQIHPTYAYGWFQLGRVLQKENDKANARKAYQRATNLDEKLLAPHLGLASLAFADENWKEVLDFTSPILERDPFKSLTGYTVELEPFNYGETYYYNAVANYQLKQFDAAERSARKAQQLLARSPQLHVLMARIFARKQDYPAAITELKTYLELDPHAKDAELVRARIAELESKAAADGQEPHQN